MENIFASLLAPITLFGQATTALELWATAFTVACVLLADFRKVFQYPVGIIGTILFFFVFQTAGLMSSAYLQIMFLAVQFYGWWFWLRGDRGSKPQITTLSNGDNWAKGQSFLGAVFVGAGLGAGIGLLINAIYPTANMLALDAQIFGLSIVAQFLLDRKKLENWIMWGIINIMSVYVYNKIGLTFTTFLYVGLFFNTMVGFLLWLREYRGYAKPVSETA